jgi:hypothetical protein
MVPETFPRLRGEKPAPDRPPRMLFRECSLASDAVQLGEMRLTNCIRTASKQLLKETSAGFFVIVADNPPNSFSSRVNTGEVVVSGDLGIIREVLADILVIWSYPSYYLSCMCFAQVVESQVLRRHADPCALVFLSASRSHIEHECNEGFLACVNAYGTSPLADFVM